MTCVKLNVIVRCVRELSGNRHKILSVGCSNTADCSPGLLSPEEISLQQICQTPDDATTGYILEVDMEYPPELHDLHNNYSLSPERMTITPNQQH
ncbi:hypothetical protein AVEN_143431-1 [Araneus ventricosus]|uniref:Uncharacterized protein n=1 Tax=Araneus ventricosus TaxID=182803 RepID=A0A4Y2QFL8_ARAVE|nr:hypothetical protein AVEN_143431-1 [Araneus ventricosus]